MGGACASVTACKNNIPCVGDMGLNDKLSVSRALTSIYREEILY